MILKKIMFLGTIAVILILTCTGCNSVSTEQISSTETQSKLSSIEDITSKKEKPTSKPSDRSTQDKFSRTEESSKEESYKYDILQTIFLNITPDTTIKELEAFIVDNSLCYTSEEYNKTSGGKTIKYKIAYTDGAAKQQYADSGDHLEVDFDRDQDDKLMTAQYVKSGKSKYGLLYCYGNWYDFSTSNAEDYSGYYIIDQLAPKDGITIQYTNGNETATKYFPYNSAEEVIKAIG